ncbi:hypothetical protein ABZY31_21905 [Streptomyces sp. NPDC006529]|uniref:hypothetical protein n=1 Tax=Streptomyces sp. NPDC006529 TaxID=3157177 RepID=UPI0033A430D8
MLFAVPGTTLPLPFVEIDNGTEGPPILAKKITDYRRFFARTVSQDARDVVLWRTVAWVPFPRSFGRARPATAPSRGRAPAVRRVVGAPAVL